MTLWLAVVLAGVVVWALKTSGYVIPQKLVEGAAMSRVAAVVTVALLASLVVSQTFQSASSVTLDARLPAVLVAGVLLYYKAPFLLVLLSAGAVAAGLRFFGIMG